MNYFLQTKLLEDKNFKRYLEENSDYIKYLNRNPSNYKHFINDMKMLYQERKVDKINNVINTVDIISTLFNNIK